MSSRDGKNQSAVRTLCKVLAANLGDETRMGTL